MNLFINSAIKWFRILFATCILCAIFQGSDIEATMDSPEKVTLSGELLKAYMVAYEDFVLNKIKPLSSGSSDLEKHLAKLESYNVEVHQDDFRYFVVFSPKNPHIKGVGAEY